jgi:hypothetical protein
MIFSTHGVAKQYSRVTSHSFKATLLSWSAKAGLSKEHRCILGYHTIDSNQSMLHYSRDEQAAPLRELKKLLRFIKLGQFKPDNTRSGYYTTSQVSHAPSILLPTPKVAPAPSSASLSNNVVVHVVEPAAQVESSSDHTSSSDSESSNAMSAEEKLAKQLDIPVSNRKRPKIDPSVLFAIHFRYRTVHMVPDSATSKLKCGRKLSAVFKIVPSLPTFDYHRCIDCFGPQA